MLESGGNSLKTENRIRYGCLWSAKLGEYMMRPEMMSFYYEPFTSITGSHGGSDGRPRFDPWVGMIPWRRAWQPTPVLLLGEFHGQRSPAGYVP